MFYLKHNGQKLPIESDNVYTQCPCCGREFPFNIADAVTDGQLDLYGLSVYCAECADPITWLPGQMQHIGKEEEK